MGYYNRYNQWPKYVSVAERKQKAAKHISSKTKMGINFNPIVIEGRTIARTFWGKAWCDNLESYSDYSNRLPRGRTYVRNGSVVHLQIEPGKVTALVSGSDLYQIKINIDPVKQVAWRALKKECAGHV